MLKLIGTSIGMIPLSVYIVSLITESVLYELVPANHAFATFVYMLWIKIILWMHNRFYQKCSFLLDFKFILLFMLTIIFGVTKVIISFYVWVIVWIWADQNSTLTKTKMFPFILSMSRLYFVLEVFFNVFQFLLILFFFDSFFFKNFFFMRLNNV